VSLYAALQDCPSVQGLSREGALELLRALPGDRLSTVTGWDGAIPDLEPAELAALPPALVLHTSLHGFRLTRAAAERLPPGQQDLAERQFEPEWCERHMERLLTCFGVCAGFDAARLDRFMTGLQQAGIGAMEDMLVLDEAALRVIQASPWRGRIRCWASPGLYRSLGPALRDAVAGLKLFADGAVGARTAAMARPFRDGGHGLLLHPGRALDGQLADLAPLGRPLAIHAIGGLAVARTLDALERAAVLKLAFPWVRLEHVQFISLPDAMRAKALGVILCMQPNFSSDSLAYADRLEALDLEGNNPFRMLLDVAGFRCGEDLILGSDGMPHGVEAALQWSLFPPFPGQRLTVEEVVAGFGLPPEGQGRSVLGVEEERGAVRLLRSEAQ
jgi:hypothetical protein